MSNKMDDNYTFKRNSTNNNKSYGNSYDNSKSYRAGSKPGYCCKKCKNVEKLNSKCCVCVVPRKQRRVKLGNEGCRTCNCKGCTKEDKHYFEQLQKGLNVIDNEGTEYISKDRRGGYTENREGGGKMYRGDKDPRNYRDGRNNREGRDFRTKRDSVRIIYLFV